MGIGALVGGALELDAEGGGLCLAGGSEEEGRERPVSGRGAKDVALGIVQVDLSAARRCITGWALGP